MAKQLVGICIMLLWLAAPAQANWHRAESDHFIIIAELDEAELRERAIELESLDRAMRAMTNTPDEPAELKLRVFMVTNVGEVGRYYGSGNAAGYYTPSMRGAYAVVPRRNVASGQLGMTSDNVLFHEYAHHFMAQFASGTYPSWYIEGFAELFATAEMRGAEWVEIGRPLPRRVALYQIGRRLRMAEMLSNTVPNSDMTYSQGWMLTHYAAFNAEAGELLRQYLQALSDGVSGPDAYASTFGQMDEPLDRVLRDYGLGRRLPGLAQRITPIDPASVTITALTDEDADIAMLFPRSPDQLERRVRRLADRYPENPQIHVELARSLLADGETDAAIEAIDRALELDPNNVDANNMKGTQLLLMAHAEDDASHPNWNLAREHYLTANRANPRSASALHGYFDSFPTPETRPDNAIDALESAFILIPQNPHLRIDLANVYLARGDYRDALNAIMPVYQTPHSEPDDEIAQIVAAARQGMTSDRPVSDADGE
ncbi:tetratricopeptide repeat protein [Parasphingopyxis sp. CP4]|uniref:tetratricopeptide repeat protein n=1 Tax=Parasphingopyxis sp. CP4 TaxID=2724527 RepID=UPI0015A2F892|nr:tetratricopeptide repeat protein [Parasphingopyxis sp. CP4]QLC21867.1 tetratricopeptide repeat protein [Parasphingopyxis sp. CP4]